MEIRLHELNDTDDFISSFYSLNKVFVVCFLLFDRQVRKKNTELVFIIGNDKDEWMEYKWTIYIFGLLTEEDALVVVEVEIEVVRLAISRVGMLIATREIHVFVKMF